MKIILHSATELELKPIKDYFGLKADQNKFDYAGHEVELFIGGVGMIATTFSLTKQLTKHHYDLAISVGIVGTYNQRHRLGDVMQVDADCFPELGADGKGGFQDMDELGLIDMYSAPFAHGKLWNNINKDISIPDKWEKVHGLTVNTVNSDLVTKRRLFIEGQPELESIEGAAFFYTCIKQEISCVQLKAISNRVEQRDKKEWEIDTALNNLAVELAFLLKEVKCKN